MFRIERVPGAGREVTLVISGDLCDFAREEVARAVEHALGETSMVLLDLRDVTCVDRGFVRYLAETVGGSVSIAGCPSYLSRWVSQEQSAKDDPPQSGNV